MQKIQVFLREDQKAALKVISTRTGKKQSELIRKSVDLLIESTEQGDSSWREATRLAAGLWRDRTDIDDASVTFRETFKRRFTAGRN